jgi:hypothetical protein
MRIQVDEYFNCGPRRVRWPEMYFLQLFPSSPSQRGAIPGRDVAVAYFEPRYRQSARGKRADTTSYWYDALLRGLAEQYEGRPTSSIVLRRGNDG